MKIFQRKNMANFISLCRIFVLPLLFLSAFFDMPFLFVTAIMLGILLDWLDGFIARRLKIESDLGRRLDTFFDFLVTVSELAIFIYFLRDDFYSLLSQLYPWLIFLVASDFLKHSVSLLYKRTFCLLHLNLSRASSIPMFSLFIFSVPYGFNMFLFKLTVVMVVLGNLEAAVIYLIKKKKIDMRVNSILELERK